MLLYYLYKYNIINLNKCQLQNIKTQCFKKLLHIYIDNYYFFNLGQAILLPWR